MDELMDGWLGIYLERNNKLQKMFVRMDELIEEWLENECLHGAVTNFNSQRSRQRAPMKGRFLAKLCSFKFRILPNKPASG